jgi:methionyl aminopeptidase
VIYRKSPEELAAMHRGGRILAGALQHLSEMIVPGATTAQLDAAFARILESEGATASFKGYNGFPSHICASPNEVIVHGFPNDEPLQEGAVVSIDLGVFYEGFHTDSAWTFPVGEVDPQVARLLDVTQAALTAGIEQAIEGKRVGDIGAAVEATVEPSGFSLVEEYAGHGVGRSLHEDPWVPNFGPPGKREKLEAGMTLAIEPMVNLGGSATATWDDGWTVVTDDGSVSAHFEHTVAVTPDGPLILTAAP